MRIFYLHFLFFVGTNPQRGQVSFVLFFICAVVNIKSILLFCHCKRKNFLEEVEYAKVSMCWFVVMSLGMFVC